MFDCLRLLGWIVFHREVFHGVVIRYSSTLLGGEAEACVLGLAYVELQESPGLRYLGVEARLS